MTKQEENLIRKSWSKFDRLTAYGCRSRNTEYDRDACREAWDEYQSQVSAAYPEIPPLPFPT